MADTAKETENALRFSCLACRSRKMKCDRGRPVCARCLKADMGDACEYPSSRKRPVIMATRPRVKELAARLVDLEHRLETEKQQNAQFQGSSSASGAASDPDVTDLVDTGRQEQLPPPHIVEELTNIYFARIHLEGAVLHQSRYVASLYLPPHMQPPMCLQYAVLALAANISPTYRQLAEPFYRRARQYLESEEMRGDGQGIMTVPHAQCWVLIGRFEAQHLWWSRASMSCSRAVRLAQIIGLDCLDGKAAQGQTLPPARDWCEKEERRRTFWAIFFLDRGASSTTGWPVLINHRRIQTLLPASDEAFNVGFEEPAITLQQALRSDQFQNSTSACQIIAVHIFQQCLDLNMGSSADEGSPDADVEFWAAYQELDTGLSAAFLNLPDHLKFSVQDANSILANLRLHTASICLHRAGAARMKQRDGGDGAMLMDSKTRLFVAAEEIFAIVALIGDVDAQFRNPFVAFAAFMAASVFLDDYAATQNKQSDGRLAALMDLMVAVGSTNPMTASLAVRLAHQVLQAGIDPNALEKVRHLMAAMDPDVPLMAKEEHSTGKILFCPMKAHKDPSQVFVNMHADAQRSTMNF